MGAFFRKEENDVEIEPHNIVLMGPTGSTKSSYINSVTSLCCGKYMCPAIVGGSSNHVTQAVKVYRMRDTRNIFSPFRLWDLWGISNEQNNFQDLFVQQVMEGKLPRGTNINQGLVAEDNLNEMRKPSAVIFFVPIDLMMCESALLDKLIRISKLIGKDKLVVVLSKIDTSFPNFKFQPATDNTQIFKSYPQLYECIKKAINLFNTNKVFPLINILSIEEALTHDDYSFKNQYNIYKILLEAVSTSLRFK